MPRLKYFLVSALLALPGATGLAAQDQTSVETFSERVIQLRSTNKPSARKVKSQHVAPVDVPTSLIADPSQISFEEIGNAADPSTPVPATLQAPKQLKPATSPVAVPRSAKKPTPAVEPTTILQAPAAAAQPTTTRSARSMTPRVAQANSPSWNRSSQPQQQYTQAARPATAPVSASTTIQRGNRSVSRSAPAIATEIVAPKFINVGQTAKMTIQLRNTGNSEAQSVRLIATLPAHARFEASSPQPTKVDGQQYEFSVPAIGPNQLRQVTIDLVPTKKLPLEIGTGVMLENRQQIAVGVREPMLNLRVEGPSQVTVGEVVEHVIIIENVGDGVANAVRLEADLPDELRFSEQKGMEVAKSLAPGKTQKVVVKTIAQQAGIVDLAFLAQANGAKSPNSVSKLKIVQPKLNVAMAGPKMNFVERDGIYSIRLDNAGEVAVSNVTVKLTIPAGLKITTINRPAKTDNSAQALTWTFDRIQAQSTELIQLKAIASAAGNLVCKVDVNSKETQPKQFQLDTMFATRAEMSMNIRNQSGPVQVGEKADFTITVENNGSSGSDNVTVRVELPETLMPVKQDGVTVDEYNRSFLFTKPNLQPGEKHEFKFAAVGAAGGEFVIRSVLENNNSQPNVIVEDTIYVYEVDEFRVSESLSPIINR